MASYTVNTNATQETVLTRAANEAGNTNQGMINKILLAALGTYLDQQQRADSRIQELLLKYASGAAKVSARNSLVASIAVPNVTNPGPQTTANQATVNLPIVATDPDNAQLSFSATGLPPGLGIQGPLITGKATQAGSFPVQVTATKVPGLVSSSVSFTWTVT